MNFGTGGKLACRPADGRVRPVRDDPGHQPGGLGRSSTAPAAAPGSICERPRTDDRRPLLTPSRDSVGHGHAAGPPPGRDQEPARPPRRRTSDADPARPTSGPGTSASWPWPPCPRSCFVWVVFYQLTLLSGALRVPGLLVRRVPGPVLGGTAQVVERQAATDRVIAVVVTSAAAAHRGPRRVHRGLGGRQGLPTSTGVRSSHKDQTTAHPDRPQRPQPCRACATPSSARSNRWPSPPPSASLAVRDHGHLPERGRRQGHPHRPDRGHGHERHARRWWPGSSSTRSSSSPTC